MYTAVDYFWSIFFINVSIYLRRIYVDPSHVELHAPKIYLECKQLAMKHLYIYKCYNIGIKKNICRP